MDFTQISTPRSRFTHEKAYENFSRSAVFFPSLVLPLFRFRSYRSLFAFIHGWDYAADWCI